ncbi:unnamed protein product [Timema podura]|uniref:PHD-type domain-containing protein n=1 Tax=Timema podura TaxID=61482 RepID=A0ABN7NS00_TIMPD|nr:unnamed protein product [Timema podura]
MSSRTTIAATAYFILAEEVKNQRRLRKWWNRQMFVGRNLSQQDFVSQLVAIDEVFDLKDPDEILASRHKEEELLEMLAEAGLGIPLQSAPNKPQGNSITSDPHSLRQSEESQGPQIIPDKPGRLVFDHEKYKIVHCVFQLRRSQSMEQATPVLGMIPIFSEGKDDRFEVWVHESCVVWASGVHLVGARIVGLQEAVWGSLRTMCDKCGEGGANVACVHRGCELRMHVGCAQEHGWELDHDTEGHTPLSPSCQRNAPSCRVQHIESCSRRLLGRHIIFVRDLVANHS